MNSIILKRVPPGAKQRCLDIERVVHALEGLPEGKAWRVSIAEAKSERSISQNNYYHGVVLERISQAWGVDPEDAHEWLCGARWGWRDKKVPRTPRNKDGVESVPIRTTTTDENGERSVLKTMEFEEFIEFAKRFAAQKLNLFIPDPDPNYLMHREREEKAA